MQRTALRAAAVGARYAACINARSAKMVKRIDVKELGNFMYKNR
jgi:hypothetical protein